MQNYASLQETHDQDEEGGVIYHVAEATNPRWNQVVDLDSFFTRMYKYHQKHGFMCMLIQELFELNQFVFVVILTSYLMHGIDYQVLFKNKPPAHESSKVTLSDVVLPVGECVENFTVLTWFVLIIAVFVWLLKLIRGIYHMIHFWDIKQFYNTALHIQDNNLDNLTWHEVQTRIKVVQLEQQMCIHKRELTNLDIYHRILRQENYLVAMVNKKLLPPHINVPLIGEVVYWSHCLRYNIIFLLFWSPWSPFENPWHLREEYRKAHLRDELADNLSKQILWLALLNLIFAPIILLWQILYAFFNYAELLRREPGQMGMRHWSLYGQLYLRHFNELDHELHARLTRAYRPATKYLAAFSSPMVVLFAQHLAFICGAIFGVILVLTIYDEDVISVEHLLTLMTVLGAVIAICRGLIPDGTTICSPEPLLFEVVKHTHYLPANWKGQAHTIRIRSEFQQLFQYRVVGLLEELLSPIITPYVLFRNIYPRALDLVDFFRNFTVSVMGVGDVCSFAQMDVRKHGNPDWQSRSEMDGQLSVIMNETPPTQYMQGEDGKVELSLMHFTATNPSWDPPPEAKEFVEHVPKQQDEMEASLGCPNGYGSVMQPFSRSVVPEQPVELISGPESMIFSAIFLHDRHHRQTGGRNIRSAGETTPLLSVRP